MGHTSQADLRCAFPPTFQGPEDRHFRDNKQPAPWPGCISPGPPAGNWITLEKTLKMIFCGVGLVGHFNEGIVVLNNG